MEPFAIPATRAGPSLIRELQGSELSQRSPRGRLEPRPATCHQHHRGEVHLPDPVWKPTTLIRTFSTSSRAPLRVAGGRPPRRAGHAACPVRSRRAVPTARWPSY